MIASVHTFSQIILVGDQGLLLREALSNSAGL